MNFDLQQTILNFMIKKLKKKQQTINFPIIAYLPCKQLAQAIIALLSSLDIREGIIKITDNILYI